MLYCLGCAGGFLLLVSLLLGWLERKLRLTEGVPKDLLEESGPVWASLNFVMESVFLVLIPTVGYGFFYLILPVSGVRAGFASALFAFVLGSAPVMFGLSTRLKLPMPLLLYALLSHFVKLAGSLAIIAYLYSL